MTDKKVTIKEAYENIINYFEENEDTFAAALEELDAWNGYLGDDRYYEMETLDELYSSTEPLELLYRTFYGYDADAWNYDAHGEKTYGAFNPNRNYFYYNGYGNLVSSDYKDYSDHMDEYTIEAMLDNIDYIDTIDDDDELRTLFDALQHAYDDKEAQPC